MLCISGDRKKLVSFYFSEPILTHAALDWLLEFPLPILQYLHSAFQRADLGPRGEFTSLASCLLLMDRPLSPPSAAGGASAEIPVHIFLQRMFMNSPVTVMNPSKHGQRSANPIDIDANVHARALHTAMSAPDVSSATSLFAALSVSEKMATPRASLASSAAASSSSATSAFKNDHRDIKFSGISELAVLTALRCRRATINLTHFVALGQEPNSVELEEYYLLSAGLLMKRGFAAIDWLVPIRLEYDNGSVVYSMIAVQVKNHGSGVSEAAARACHHAISWDGVFPAPTKKRGSKGAVSSASVPPPFISLIFSVRETKKRPSNIRLEVGTQSAQGNAAMTCTLRGFPLHIAPSVRTVLESMVCDEDRVTTLVAHYGSKSDRSWTEDVLLRAQQWK